MLADETVQAVRERANVADVIGERIKLTRRGRSLVGLCPFHKEKTPSFHVNDERGFYYCFGCHASGDAIRFVQETEGLSFTEAIRELASRFGIEIVETRGEHQRDDSARKRNDELYRTNEIAADFFEQCLATHPLSHHAKDELARRGLDPPQGPDDPKTATLRETLAAFRIGYAPYSWDALSLHLRDAGANLKSAESVGLVAGRKQGAGFYDRFRHRLMFAVVDLRGRIVAFSGRALDEPNAKELERLGVAQLGTTSDGNVAKYINSPESPIYKKRELVFGLYQARDAIRQKDACVLVEGNFDVVALHARGIAHVVAPLGTAFTQEQAAQIRRYSANLTLLFDADAAGRKATVASREPCKAEGLVPKVAELPDGVDPDDFVRSRGAEALLHCIRNAKGMLEFMIEGTLERGFGVADAETRGRKLREVLELIKAEDDPTVRALARAHADTIAARLGISDVGSLDALSRALRGATSGAQSRPSVSNLAPERARSKSRRGAVEAEIIGAIVEHPALLQHPDVQDLLKHATGGLALAVATLKRNANALEEHLHDFDPEFRDVVARRLAAPELLEQQMATEVLLDNLERLASLDHRHSKEETMEQLRKAEASGDVETATKLLTRLRESSREQEQRRQRSGRRW